MCEIIHKMTKYFSTCKMWQETLHCTVSYYILYKINNFSMAKLEAMLLLAKPISEEKSLYTDAFD